eukprot:156436-Amphidinium_carterae.1
MGTEWGSSFDYAVPELRAAFMHAASAAMKARVPIRFLFPNFPPYVTTCSACFGIVLLQPLAILGMSFAAGSVYILFGRYVLFGCVRSSFGTHVGPYAMPALSKKMRQLTTWGSTCKRTIAFVVKFILDNCLCVAKRHQQT